MKVLKVLFLVIGYGLPLGGQSTVNSNPDSILYVNAVDEAFMIDKETKSLLKFNPFSSFYVIGEQNLSYELALEMKLSKALSITPALSVNVSNGFSRLYQIEGGISSRYYYNMPSQISKGKQANNLSGVYLGASVFYNKNYSFEIPVVEDRRSVNYGLRWGKQKRFLNYGYMDVFLQFDYAKNFVQSEIFPGFVGGTNSFSMSIGMDVGFGFGKNYSISDDATCPIFRCHMDRNTGWKFNYRRTFSVSYFPNQGSIRGGTISTFLNPNIIYEKKIGESAFSFEVEMNAIFSLYASTFQSMTINNQFYGEVNFSAGLKYYVDLKKRVQEGRSGNNLSGYYVFGRPLVKNIIYRQKNIDFVGIPARNTTDEFTSIQGQVGLGYQKELLNNVFIDFQLGVSKSFYYSNIQIRNNVIDFISEIKVGFILDNLLDVFDKEKVEDMRF